MLDHAGPKGKPNFEDVKKHLENYQNIRNKRSQETSIMANAYTRVHALHTWKDKLLAYYLIPALGDM